jgi:hypothetical protein
VGGSSQSLVQDNILAFCRTDWESDRNLSQQPEIPSKCGGGKHLIHILACELNLNSDTSGSSGRIVTAHNSTDFETRNFKSEEVRLQGFTGLEICTHFYKGQYMRNFVDIIPL